MTAVVVNDKVLLIMSLPIPYDMAFEIISFLFIDSITARSKSLKRNVNAFIKTNIIRYEEFDHNLKWCIWGLSFFPHSNVQIQNTNCTVCGNFVNISLCRCMLLT